MKWFKKKIDEGYDIYENEKKGRASALRSLGDYDAGDIHDIITLRRVYKSLSLNILKSRENCLFFVGVGRELMADRGQTRVENITMRISTVI